MTTKVELQPQPSALSPRGPDARAPHTHMHTRAWWSRRSHDFSAINDTSKSSPCVTAASPVITLNPIMITSLYNMLWPRDQYIKRADCRLRSGQDGWSQPGQPQAEAIRAWTSPPAPGQNQEAGGGGPQETHRALRPLTGVGTGRSPALPDPPISQGRGSLGRARPALAPAPG